MYPELGEEEIKKSNKKSLLSNIITYLHNIYNMNTNLTAAIIITKTKSRIRYCRIAHCYIILIHPNFDLCNYIRHWYFRNKREN